ncbi:hypothetical protein [Halococcus agarilyticus]|uniref:hypothetical protein n=1 Tax=Halococcus agarilyticus TaxID=1232219 RepID=UPI0006776FDF|nr:hypothetical protein [Halococcus agarilyticus]
MLVAQAPTLPGGPVVATLLLVIVVTGLVFVVVRALGRAVGGSNEGRIDDLERRVDDLEREQN